MDQATYQRSLNRMAQIALTICKVNMTQEERNNAKSFADCHDAFDANVALYGAFCGEYFAGPFDGGNSESNTETMNLVADILDSMIKRGDLK